VEFLSYTTFRIIGPGMTINYGIQASSVYKEVCTDFVNKPIYDALFHNTPAMACSCRSPSTKLSKHTWKHRISYRSPMESIRGVYLWSTCSCRSVWPYCRQTNCTNAQWTSANWRNTVPGAMCYVSVLSIPQNGIWLIHSRLISNKLSAVGGHCTAG
jgi:hypothetical protein